MDSGVRQGDQVTVDFDPMLAKLIVHASDRKSAIRRMDNALSSFVALGVTTNIGFLRNALLHPSFTSGSITTDFLDSTPIEEFNPNYSNPKIIVSIAASAKRLGLDKSANILLSSDEGDHSGHSGDPFKTLSGDFHRWLHGVGDC